MGEMKISYTILIGKSEGKRPLDGLKRWWKDNINIHLKAVRCDAVDWIHLAQDRDEWRAVLNTVMTFGFHEKMELYLLSERLSYSQDGLCYMQTRKKETILLHRSQHGNGQGEMNRTAVTSCGRLRVHSV
jgi:hypothetical protein